MLRLSRIFVNTLEMAAQVAAIIASDKARAW